MKGYAEHGDDLPTHTDSGIEIITHAHHGDGAAIVVVAALPHTALEQTPTFTVEGKKFVLAGTDEFTGGLIFREFDYTPDDTPTPHLPSEFDEEENPNALVDVVHELGGTVLEVTKLAPADDGAHAVNTDQATD